MQALAEEMTADYLDNLAALGVESIDEMPKATDHIGTIIAFIEGLIGKGYAYASDGDVYFDVTRDADDGTLAREVMPDLLHVHDKGYGIWAQAIEPTIQKLLDEK